MRIISGRGQSPLLHAIDAGEDAPRKRRKPYGTAAQLRVRKRWDADKRRRQGSGRASTENLNRLSVEKKAAILLLPVVYPPGAKRPRTRADCASVPRPCPWVGCEHNTYLEVTKAGNLTFRRPLQEPHEVPAHCSCTLDIAEREGVTLDEVGEALNVTRERARQLEERALGKLKKVVL